MRIPRIYQDSLLSVGGSVELDAQATVHVSKVLRLRVDDEVIVFNGQGGEYHGRITTQVKRSATITLESFDDRSVESPLSIILAQGVSRGERMDYTVQKAVELGVSQITPLMTKRTSVKLDGDRKQRRQLHWQAIVQGACEQSGRNAVNEIQNYGAWLGDLAQASPAACKLVLAHRAEQGIVDAVLELRDESPDASGGDTGEIVLLIGPEGGLSDEEIQLAQHHGFTSVRLGPRVMRTETAALVAISVLQSQWGDLNS